MFLGIDCGTQGTKALIFDSKTGKVAGIGHAPHEIIAADNGRREQQPSWWVDAMIQAVRKAMQAAKAAPGDIRAMSCSGQHHGLVMLDENGKVLRAAKLWNDMETAPENDEITSEAGGGDALGRRLGTAMPVGYTASKVRWMTKHEAELWKRVKHIMCPHDYLNYWLTGRMVMEPGDASGTGFFSLSTMDWDRGMVKLIDPSGVLESALPELIKSADCVGALREEAARELGLTTGTLVAGGSGDNVMGALGTGGVKDGAATFGLGTSGVLNILTHKPITNPDPVLQVFAGAGGGWLLTVCTVNATSATTSLQHMFGMELSPFAAAMGESEAGAGGLMLFPYFNGERMPPLPEARGMMSGMTTMNLTRNNVIRAGAEAVVYGLKWGYDRQMKMSTRPEVLRLTGGGTGNPVWRQIIADVFDTPAVGLVHDEGGAFGAALLAMIMQERRDKGDGIDAAALCDRYILFDEAKRVQPNPAQVSRYRELYSRYEEERRRLYGL